MAACHHPRDPHMGVQQLQYELTNKVGSVISCKVRYLQHIYSPRMQFIDSQQSRLSIDVTVAFSWILAYPHYAPSMTIHTLHGLTFQAAL